MLPVWSNQQVEGIEDVPLKGRHLDEFLNALRDEMAHCDAMEALCSPQNFRLSGMDIAPLRRGMKNTFARVVNTLDTDSARKLGVTQDEVRRLTSRLVDDPAGSHREHYERLRDIDPEYPMQSVEDGTLAGMQLRILGRFTQALAVQEGRTQEYLRDVRRQDDEATRLLMPDIVEARGDDRVRRDTGYSMVASELLAQDSARRKRERGSLLAGVEQSYADIVAESSCYRLAALHEIEHDSAAGTVKLRRMESAMLGDVSRLLGLPAPVQRAA